MKARGFIAATTVVGAACVALAGVLLHETARSSDHLDSPAAAADPTVDLADLYSWVDGSNVVLAATVYPAAPQVAMFSDAAQYVFHVASGNAYGAMTKNYDIICTFSGTVFPQQMQCWGGTNEYVTGNAGDTAGVTSADGKMKVFAGLRADPFFFNLDGYKAAVGIVESASGSLTYDDAGCPDVGAAASSALVAQLAHAPDGGAPTDFFANLDALAIVVSVDRSLVTAGGPVIAVWASTHK
jgi:hypothetical protein